MERATAGQVGKSTQPGNLSMHRWCRQCRQCRQHSDRLPDYCWPSWPSSFILDGQARIEEQQQEAWLARHFNRTELRAPGPGSATCCDSSYPRAAQHPPPKCGGVARASTPHATCETCVDRRRQDNINIGLNSEWIGWNA